MTFKKIRDFYGLDVIWFYKSVRALESSTESLLTKGKVQEQNNDHLNMSRDAITKSERFRSFRLVP